MNIHKHRAKTALKEFTYKHLDWDVKQLLSDRKKIKALQSARDRCMILKPDKGQGIVLINTADYYQSLERLFGDRKKFEVLDPTLTKVVYIRATWFTFKSKLKKFKKSNFIIIIK